MAGPLLFAAAIGAPLGCAPARDPLDRLKADPALAELMVIQDADPARALDAAWRRGEKRFLGVRLFALAVPGAEPPTGELDELVFEKQGVRVIEGTTDNYRDEEHKRMVDGALRYAERYNTLLLRRLGVGPVTKPSE